jgi:NADP-dependent 3-hydroxy acid dehydrogenase YdfG
MPRLANKTALITGGAGGQGAADAELMVSEGAALMLTDIDAARGEALAARLRDGGGKVQFMVQDVADEESWKRVVAATTGVSAACTSSSTMPARSRGKASSIRQSRRGIALSR